MQQAVRISRIHTARTFYPLVLCLSILAVTRDASSVDQVTSLGAAVSSSTTIQLVAVDSQIRPNDTPDSYHSIGSTNAILQLAWAVIQLYLSSLSSA